MRNITPERKANEMLVMFIGDKGQDVKIMEEARRNSIIACQIVLAETSSTFFYRVIEVLKRLNF